MDTRILPLYNWLSGLPAQKGVVRFTVKDACACVGVSERTLRWYLSIGEEAKAFSREPKSGGMLGVKLRKHKPEPKASLPEMNLIAVFERLQSIEQQMAYVVGSIKSGNGPVAAFSGEGLFQEPVLAQTPEPKTAEKPKPQKTSKPKTAAQAFVLAVKKKVHKPMIARYSDFMKTKKVKENLTDKEFGALGNIKVLLIKQFDDKTRIGISQSEWDAMGEPEKVELLASQVCALWDATLSSWGNLPAFHHNRIALSSIYTDLTSILAFLFSEKPAPNHYAKPTPEDQLREKTDYYDKLRDASQSKYEDALARVAERLRKADAPDEGTGVVQLVLE